MCRARLAGCVLAVCVRCVRGAAAGCCCCWVLRLCGAHGSRAHGIPPRPPLFQVLLGPGKEAVVAGMADWVLQHVPAAKM